MHWLCGAFLWCLQSKVFVSSWGRNQTPGQLTTTTIKLLASIVSAESEDCTTDMQANVKNESNELNRIVNHDVDALVLDLNITSEMH